MGVLGWSESSRVRPACHWHSAKGCICRVWRQQLWRWQVGNGVTSLATPPAHDFDSEDDDRESVMKRRMGPTAPHPVPRWMQVQLP